MSPDMRSNESVATKRQVAACLMPSLKQSQRPRGAAGAKKMNWTMVMAVR